MIRKEIKKIKAYQLKAEQAKIKINQNELPYDLNPLLKKKALKRLASLDWNRYPRDRPVSLIRALAKKEGVKDSQIVVSNGSNVLVQALIAATSIQAKVMVLDPSFSVYELEAKIFSNKVIKFPLNKNDFSWDIKNMVKQIKKEKPSIVFIPNPNAPTGTLFSKKDLESVIKATRSMVVIDEAYYDFSKATVLPWIKKYKNLVVLRTLSKAYGLGGVRVGYMIAREDIAQEVYKVVMPYCLSQINQVLAELLLEEEDQVKKRVEEILQEREKVYQQLAELKTIQVYPSSANFIYFTSKAHQKIFQGLLNEGILIRQVSTRSYPNALRVSIGSPKENSTFLKAMKKILSD